MTTPLEKLIIKTPNYNFECDWEAVGTKTKLKFIKKVQQIENDAIKRTAADENIDEETIREEITHLDYEEEWNSFCGCEELPADITWIEFEMEFMKQELREKGIC